MSFADDPQMGLLSDRFTGSATASLTTDIIRDADRIAALSIPVIASYSVRGQRRFREPIDP